MSQPAFVEMMARISRIDPAFIECDQIAYSDAMRTRTIVIVSMLQALVGGPAPAAAAEGEAGDCTAIRAVVAAIHQGNPQAAARVKVDFATGCRVVGGALTCQLRLPRPFPGAYPGSAAHDGEEAVGRRVVDCTSIAEALDYSGEFSGPGDFVEGSVIPLEDPPDVEIRTAVVKKQRTYSATISFVKDPKSRARQTLAAKAARIGATKKTDAQGPAEGTRDKAGSDASNDDPPAGAGKGVETLAPGPHVVDLRGHLRLEFKVPDGFTGYDAHTGTFLQITSADLNVDLMMTVRAASGLSNAERLANVRRDNSLLQNCEAPLASGRERPQLLTHCQFVVKEGSGQGWLVVWSIAGHDFTIVIEGRPHGNGAQVGQLMEMVNAFQLVRVP